MTPQGNFLILAPVRPDREKTLRGLLASMNQSVGVVDPSNALIPFGDFDRVHFARLLILTDPNAADIAVYDVPVPHLPKTLAFFVDCDGPGEAVLRHLATRAATGLRQLFSCCEGLEDGADLLEWMLRHQKKAAASYVNTVGRTVRQIREEAALYDALADYLSAPDRALAIREPRALWCDLAAHAEALIASGSVTLSEPDPTPFGWWLANLANAVGGALLVLLLLPFAILIAPVYLWLLRRHERTDPQIIHRPDPSRHAEIARREDHDVTNPYIVVGCLKPGLFRLLTAIVLLAITGYGARHIFNRGHLARVQTIHCARWVFLNGRRQLIFASNYDGSQESYMDDFINKVGWGLNVLFSNGVGYPTTNWLIFDGSSDEQAFEDFIFTHQLPIDVWYKAYPGLTAFDLRRNGLIRDGLKNTTMSDEEIREWLNLF
jgi:hypothetical protein